MARILMVGKGSYGDMFPLFAIAQSLKAAGHMVTVATQQQHMEAVTSIEVAQIAIDASGATAGPIIADQSSLGLGLGNIGDLFRTLAPQSLPTEYDAIARAVQSSDLIIGNQLAYAGAMAAKKWKKPWVFCAASPLAIPSYSDPPLFPYLQRLQRQTRHYPGVQAGLIALARHASRLMMQPHIRLQKRLDVHDGRHPRFEGMYSDLLNIMPVSSALLASQPDWPAHTVVTGFNWFDPTFMRSGSELDRIMAFIDRGEAPIVIAPSGMQRIRPGNFFQESLAACKLLGRRAIVIAAKRFHAKIEESANVLVSGYIPYSDVLGHVAAMIHCGGVGTIGWSLRFALPTLLVPFEWDQFDNADRAQRRHLASVIERQHLNAANVADALDQLLKNSHIKNALAQASQVVAREDGATVALTEIESLLARL